MKAVIGLGTNIGERAENLKQEVQELQHLSCCRIRVL